jgi:hypothetical protein
MVTDNRKAAISLLFIGILCILIIIGYPDKSINYGLGLVTGTALGILSCLYIRKINSGVSKPEIPNKGSVNSIWMPISVIGGMILARVIFGLIDYQLETILLNAVLSWITLTFSYISWKVW